ncbi:MAG: type 2 isopentenyl-diphosphate Delta-isomerase [Bernardetiaceae bacterium]|nr:type 2 isopentenyl-diphosphate Delta-isomerase [Bernardetiaceae bacterium]
MSKTSMPKEDENSSMRKKDHIELAFRSQLPSEQLDKRFMYEPLLSGHPKHTITQAFDFLNAKMKVPIWVSSMTGGTAMARTINHNLAKACGEYGMGMGLGSCRMLLDDDTYFEDFNVRHLMPLEPLYANLGIAQVAELIAQNQIAKIQRLIDKLQATGLIIHVNPMQEWLQPEGDRFAEAPIITISKALELLPDLPIIVKEVGQGMGYESLKALLEMPLEALDFAASGGTNFALLELLRSRPEVQENFKGLACIGHNADEMMHMSNQIIEDLGERTACRQLIISGGVKDFLDGYYLTQKSKLPAIYGQASAFLRHAQASYENLQAYIEAQIEGFSVAKAFLKVR